MAEKSELGKSYTQRVLIAAAVVGLIILGLVLVYFTFDILLLIFAAALLSIFLRGLADILPPEQVWETTQFDRP